MRDLDGSAILEALSGLSVFLAARDDLGVISLLHQTVNRSDVTMSESHKGKSGLHSYFPFMKIGMTIEVLRV